MRSSHLHTHSSIRLCSLIVKHSWRSTISKSDRILLPAILPDYYQTCLMMMILYQNDLPRLQLLLLNAWKLWNNQIYHHLHCEHPSVHPDNLLRLHLQLHTSLSTKREFHLNQIMSMVRGDILSSSIKMQRNSLTGRKTINEQPWYQLFLDLVLQNLRMRYQIEWNYVRKGE